METKQFSPAELIRNNFPRPREGNRKGGRWAKRTTCFRGHALTEDNIYVERRGDGTFRRRCRMCWIENAKRYNAKHREKILARNRERYRENKALGIKEDPQQHRGHILKYKYGITNEEYDTLFKAQNGVCVICLKPPDPGKVLQVDHNHRTRKVRGLVHARCNATIGWVERKPGRTERVIDMLQSRIE